MDAPKSVSRPKRRSAEVEEAYRFQLAGYKDENEYINIQSVGEVSYNMCSNPTSYLYVHGNVNFAPQPTQYCTGIFYFSKTWSMGLLWHKICNS